MAYTVLRDWRAGLAEAIAEAMRKPFPMTDRVPQMHSASARPALGGR